jgi:hypothetical protein
MSIMKPVGSLPALLTEQHQLVCIVGVQLPGELPVEPALAIRQAIEH